MILYIHIIFSFVLFFVSYIVCTNIKSLDDSILFKINWPGKAKWDLYSAGGNQVKDSMITKHDQVILTSSNNEKYTCLIPKVAGDSQADVDTYSGPSAASLLMPLFKKQLCTLRFESFWTYEMCHGQYIKQFHEIRENKVSHIQEYILGQTSAKELEQFDLPGVPLHKKSIMMTKVEGLDIPYFLVNYTGGTLCDLTEMPRMSRVLYVCQEDRFHEIYSIKETFTCEYEIVILTHLLCQHPLYRPKDIEVNNLDCLPMKEGPTRPRNLLHFDAESLRLRSQGIVLSSDLSKGTVRLEVIDDTDSAILENEPLSLMPAVSVFSHRPPVDQELITDFLNGDYCLHGGTGWWKYEFCYGKKVLQYHQDKSDSSKIVIQLGIFDVKAHKEWIQKNPTKAHVPGKMHVSHLYTKGTHCDSTGKARQVEVKLKCIESGSPSSVTLYLLEPKTCEYILGVETLIVCPLLEHADKNGLFTLENSVNDPK